MKFYQQNWFMWIMLFLFFPVGLFLLWTQSDYTKRSKIVITGLILVSVVWWMSGGGA